MTVAAAEAAKVAAAEGRRSRWAAARQAVDEADGEAAGPSTVPSASPAWAGGAPAGLSRDALADACVRRAGFRLQVAPSAVGHPGAGLGLFLKGEARPGMVVALVPGVVYARTQYKHMPNYPQIDAGNHFLSSLYDMSIVDSLAWERRASGPPGSGVGALPESGGGTVSGEAVPPAASTSDAAPAAKGAHVPAGLALLEGRHPWAVGHYVNHPPQGSVPNVLELSFTLDLSGMDEEEEGWLRAYLPWMPFQAEPYTGADLAPPCSVSGLLLLATRPILDGQEVLLNYRLSPHVPRPAWYHSHAPEEEERRWAKMPVVLGF